MAASKTLGVGRIVLCSAAVGAAGLSHEPVLMLGSVGVVLLSLPMVLRASRASDGVTILAAIMSVVGAVAIDRGWSWLSLLRWCSAPVVLRDVLTTATREWSRRDLNSDTVVAASVGVAMSVGWMGLFEAAHRLGGAGWLFAVAAVLSGHTVVAVWGGPSGAAVNLDATIMLDDLGSGPGLEAGLVRFFSFNRFTYHVSLLTPLSSPRQGDDTEALRKPAMERGFSVVDEIEDQLDDLSIDWNDELPGLFTPGWPFFIVGSLLPVDPTGWGSIVSRSQSCTRPIDCYL